MSTEKDASTKLAMIVGTISTPNIRDFTIEMMKVAPPSFRTAKASENHHPLDERGPAGNSLHSLRVTMLVRLIADTCDLSPLLVDILTSAGILHDSGRYGLDDKDEYTSKEHALVPRKIAEKHSITCEHADVIFQVMEQHMGRWGPQPYTPKLSLGVILHLADAISAHADEVWEQLGGSGSSWVSGVPFSVVGMTQEKMSLLGELAEDDKYWKTALGFVRSSSTREWTSLTTKQQDWMQNISDSLTVELSRKESREAFELEPEDIPF